MCGKWASWSCGPLPHRAPPAGHRAPRLHINTPELFMFILLLSNSSPTVKLANDSLKWCKWPLSAFLAVAEIIHFRVSVYRVWRGVWSFTVELVFSLILLSSPSNILHKQLVYKCGLMTYVMVCPWHSPSYCMLVENLKQIFAQFVGVCLDP